MDDKMSWPMGDGEIAPPPPPQKKKEKKKRGLTLIIFTDRCPVRQHTALQGDAVDRVTVVYTILTVKSVYAEFGKAEKRLRDTPVHR